MLLPPLIQKKKSMKDFYKENESFHMRAVEPCSEITGASQSMQVINKYLWLLALPCHM